MAATPDRDKLQAIADRSTSRAALADVAVCLLKSAQLMRWGYSVAHWFIVSERRLVLEYNPLHAGDPRTLPGYRGLPRLVCWSIGTQREIHEALGLTIWTPGYEQAETLDLFPAEAE